MMKFDFRICLYYIFINSKQYTYYNILTTIYFIRYILVATYTNKKFAFWHNQIFFSFSLKVLHESYCPLY